VKKVSFIIVNYNTRELLEKCVGNLVGIYPVEEIVVVDNGSTDGSPQMIKEKFGEKVILIETQDNGLAAGNNLGYEKSTGDYLLYLGSDAFPRSEVINTLVGYMNEHIDCGICTAKLVLRDGSMDWDAHRGFPTPWSALTYFSHLNRVFPKSKVFNQYYLGYKDMAQPHEIDACICHFMFVRREVHSVVGKWDEDFFLFGEDIDFCYRTKQAGYKIMFLPQIEVLHYKGATIGRKTARDIKVASQSDKQMKKRVTRESTRAMKLFYQKHYSNKYPKALTDLVLFGVYLLEKIRSLFGLS